MKRTHLRNLAHFEGIDFDCRSEVEVPEYELTESQLQSVLDEVFSVDPVSGFPKGDIAYFLSKDGNPQVKAWLESNLLSPRAKQSGTTIEGVTDDFIAEYARNEGESAMDYQVRLRGYYDSAKAEVEKFKALQSQSNV